MNRRRFLGRLGLGVAGACCAAGQLEARRVGGQSAPKRREVSVGGRRVRTIDVHAHCMIPEVASLVQGTPLAAAMTITPSVVIGPTRVREMDNQGIDVEVLSVNPFWYSADRELSARLIDLQNEKLADICVQYPDRFTALASVALQHPDLAAA